MEIIKQLFDIASLFDIVTDLSVTAETFNKFAIQELQYRGLEANSTQSVLEDIYDTALCIVLRGQNNPAEFQVLQDGIKKVRGFIHSEVYSLEHAITKLYILRSFQAFRRLFLKMFQDTLKMRNIATKPGNMAKNRRKRGAIRELGVVTSKVNASRKSIRA